MLSQGSVNMDSPNPEDLSTHIELDPTPSSTQAETAPVALSRKRKLTLVVWNDFTREKFNGEDIATCNHCSARLKCDSRNGTKHLHNHLDRCVKRKNVDIRQQILTMQQRKTDGKVQMGGFTFDQDVSRRDLAHAIILHEYPLSIVNHVAFKKFVKGLQPLFKMVSRNTIRSDIIKIYEGEKLKTIKMLENLNSRIAITTDMWTSNQKKGYMSLTVHFVDDCWLLQHRLISDLFDIRCRLHSFRCGGW